MRSSDKLDEMELVEMTVPKSSSFILPIITFPPQLNSLRKASFLSEQFIGKAVNLEEFIKGKAAWLVAGAESSKSQMVAASQNYDEADKRESRSV